MNSHEATEIIDKVWNELQACRNRYTKIFQATGTSSAEFKKEAQLQKDLFKLHSELSVVQNDKYNQCHM